MFYQTNKKTFGIIVCLIGIIFSISETIYFGDNFLPQSIQELTCDIISILLVYLGALIYRD